MAQVKQCSMMRVGLRKFGTVVVVVAAAAAVVVVVGHVAVPAAEQPVELEAAVEHRRFAVVGHDQKQRNGWVKTSSYVRSVVEKKNAYVIRDTKSQNGGCLEGRESSSYIPLRLLNLNSDSI